MHRPRHLHAVQVSRELPRASEHTLYTAIEDLWVFVERRWDRRGFFYARFDVQVHQSLPFMDFSSAKWEMLVAVRNFFRDAAPDQSVYDELLVVRPPKRVIGGLTLKF